MSADKCEVCSKQSHGIHFGAVTCRACAAYFRRAILKKYAQLECINGKEKCDRYSELCKKCRLEKCYDVGMSDERVQLGRDPMSSTVKKIPPSIQYFIGRPTFILFCDPETKNRSSIDFTKLIENASTILSSTSKCYVGMNTLNQLTNALTAFTSRSEPPKMCQKIGKDETLNVWEICFLRVARWFTHCDKFQELPLNMRIEFLKIVWMTWSSLQRDVKTANLKLEKVDETTKKGFLSNEYTFDVEKTELDLSWFSKDNFLGSLEENYTSRLIGALMSFRPTPQETTYMLSVFSFRHVAKVLGDDFEALSETMIQTLANDLHSYYISEMKIMQYAPRIAQMMKIVNILDRNLYDKMERFELARMFDAVLVDFSHPEMIYGKK